MQDFAQVMPRVQRMKKSGAQFGWNEGWSSTFRSPSNPAPHPSIQRLPVAQTVTIPWLSIDNTLSPGRIYL